MTAALRKCSGACKQDVATRHTSRLNPDDSNVRSNFSRRAMPLSKLQKPAKMSISRRPRNPGRISCWRRKFIRRCLTGGFRRCRCGVGATGLRPAASRDLNWQRGHPRRSGLCLRTRRIGQLRIEPAASSCRPSPSWRDSRRDRPMPGPPTSSALHRPPPACAVRR